MIGDYAKWEKEGRKAALDGLSRTHNPYAKPEEWDFKEFTAPYHWRRGWYSITYKPKVKPHWNEISPEALAARLDELDQPCEWLTLYNRVTALLKKIEVLPNITIRMLYPHMRVQIGVLIDDAEVEQYERPCVVGGETRVLELEDSNEDIVREVYETIVLLMIHELQHWFRYEDKLFIDPHASDFEEQVNDEPRNSKIEVEADSSASRSAGE